MDTGYKVSSVNWDRNNMYIWDFKNYNQQVYKGDIISNENISSGSLQLISQ